MLEDEPENTHNFARYLEVHYGLEAALRRAEKVLETKDSLKWKEVADLLEKRLATVNGQGHR